jgi:Domain of unknown function (DUF4290)
MDYNTQRELITITEYGRSVQEMVNFLKQLTDPGKIQKNAEAIVETMALLNSHHKGVEDYKQKFWNHLYVLTNYEIDFESPYGKPEREAKEAKPEPLAYPGNKIRWNHLGKNVQELFNKGMAETDSDKQKGYAQALGNYIKIAYKNYHDENSNDDAIKDELAHMSKGVLQYEANEFRKWVDGTLNESAAVNNIRTHKENKNYGSTGGRNNNNNNRFKNKFGGNNNSGNKFKRR